MASNHHAEADQMRNDLRSVLTQKRGPVIAKELSDSFREAAALLISWHDAAKHRAKKASQKEIA